MSSSADDESLSSSSLLDIYCNTSVFIDPMLAANRPSHSLSHMYQLKSWSTRVLDMDPSVLETLSAALGMVVIVIPS